MNKTTKNYNYNNYNKNRKVAEDTGNIATIAIGDSKETLDYGFYSNVLKKPFERLDDLKNAEAVYFQEQKAKEDKAAQKKAEALRVEKAFKARNAARKAYKEDLAQLTKEYAEALENLKKAYDLGKKDLKDNLVAADEAYIKELNDFITKHPEGYHLTLKDGDLETTVSSQVATSADTKSSTDDKAATTVANIFEMLFGAL